MPTIITGQFLEGDPVLPPPPPGPIVGDDLVIPFVVDDGV